MALHVGQCGRLRGGVARQGLGPRTARLTTAQRATGGFTLIEVVTVLGLLVLLTSIAWPVLQNRITQAELPESAARVRDMLFMVRAESAMEHRRYRVRFEPEKQHPLIEYEPDPILRPNEWDPVESAWAREAGKSLLLADVQVHDIQPGRPFYLQAISIDEDPSTLMDDAELKLKEAKEAAKEGFDAGSGLSGFGEEDIEIDEARPMIVFEADGSTDWATLVLTRVPLDEALEEQSKQAWVVLDGRTGLASVHELVTEEQLADPEFYVKREKLELPDTVDASSLTFQMGGGESVAAADSAGDLAGDMTGDGSESMIPVPEDVMAGADVQDGAEEVGQKGDGRGDGGGQNPHDGDPHGGQAGGEGGLGEKPGEASEEPPTSEQDRRGGGRKPRRAGGR